MNDNKYLRLSPSAFERIYDLLSSLVEFQTPDIISILMGIALPSESVGMYSLFSDKKLAILTVISLGCVRKSQLQGNFYPGNLEFELVIILIYLAKIYKGDPKYGDIVDLIDELQGVDSEEDSEEY